MTHYRHTQIGWLIVVFMGGAVALLARLLARSGFSVVVLAGLIVSVAVFAVFSTLTIEVTDDEFRFRFSFGLFGRKIPLAAVAKCVEVKNPVLYGFGIRLTPIGKLYNVSGTKGVELRLRGGERLRVGSDEPERVCSVVEPLLAKYAVSAVIEKS